jgi:hypothetical protein
VRYWEIGDEQWGWWAKGHASPEEYAAKYKTFVKAMKAVDPTIKVATNVSLGPHPEHWTERVLKAAADDIDMLTVTFFPQRWGHENDDSLFASVATYREQFTQLKKDVETAVGKDKARSILYVNVGYNSVNHSPGPQTLRMVNALWVADMLGTMAEIGTDISCYWALHNYYPPRGGDYGYLSSDGKNSPRYSYYVFSMFVSHVGTDLVASVSSDPAISVYATRSGKKLSFLVINRSPVISKSLDIAMKSFVPQGSAAVWVLDSLRRNERLPDVSTDGNHFVLDAPVSSLMAVEVISRDSVVPPSNLALLATASASSFSLTGPHFTPQSAVDGKLYTRWNSSAWTTTDGNEEQWLQLSWNVPCRFSFVRIRWGETFGKKYTLEVSDDAKAWRTVQGVPHGRGGVEEFAFSPLSARYLRISGKQGVGGRSVISAYSVREVEVFDTSGQ